MTRTYIEGIEANGVPLNFQFATLFFRHALPLALSDFILVLSTGICVPFAKLLAKGYIKYYWTGVIIQHSWQTMVLAIAVKRTFDQLVSHPQGVWNGADCALRHRQWPWVQSGFLTLHCLVLHIHAAHLVTGMLTSRFRL